MTPSALRRRPLPVLALVAGAVTFAPQAVTAASGLSVPSLPSVPIESSGPLRLAAYSYTVERIQAGLNELGYNAGPVDGLFGGTTASAIRAYQRNNGLSVTGQASQGLLEHIRARLRNNGGSESSGQSQSTAPPAPPMPDQQSAQTAQSENQLLIDTQGQLRRLGHDVTLTGRLDDPTADAIRAYQRDKNLLVTGQPSAPLLEHMKASVAAQDTDSGETSGPSNVARVQAALNTRGYDAGPADGVMGPSTRAAIRTYQADAGLPITGQVTPDLVQRLESTPVAEESRDQDDEDRDEPEAPSWTTVFSDSFQGVGGLGQTRWSKVMGSVAVRGGGLVTQTTEAPPPTAEDLGRDLLGSVLNEALGVQVPANNRQGERAVVARSAEIGKAFRLTAQIAGGSGEGTRKINLGFFTGDNVASGLRLLYDAQGGGGWRLLRNSGGGVTTLASGGGPALSGGNRHTLRWERGADGAMSVTLDGRSVLSTGPDSGGGGGFDGVSLLNGGGTWTLYSASVAELK